MSTKRLILLLNVPVKNEHLPTKANVQNSKPRRSWECWEITVLGTIMPNCNSSIPLHIFNNNVVTLTKIFLNIFNICLLEIYSIIMMLGLSWILIYIFGTLISGQGVSLFCTSNILAELQIEAPTLIKDSWTLLLSGFCSKTSLSFLTSSIYKIDS